MRKMAPLEYGLYLLKIRDRSSGEIRHKMSQKGYLKEEIEDIILFLTNKNFLDDKRFIENFIKQKQTLSSIGKFKLKQKLINLHVEKSLISSALSEVTEESEENRAVYLAENWILKKKDFDKESQYNKLGRFLASRGFSYEVIKTVLDKVLK